MSTPLPSPQPEQWLRNCVSAYEMPNDGTWEDFSGNEAVLEGLRTAAGDVLSVIREAKNVAQMPGGPVAYCEALLSDEQQLTELAGMCFSGTVPGTTGRDFGHAFRAEELK